MARTFRFGVSLGSVGGCAEGAAKCRKAEQLASTWCRCPITWVRLHRSRFNTGFYRPALVARYAVTTAELLDCRRELGLGSGHMKSEFDEAGLPWHPPDQRAETITEIGRRRDDATPPPSSARTPNLSLLIGGNSDRVLRLAAEHADAVGFAGLVHARGHPPGTFRLADAEAMDERVAYVAQHAALRAGGVEFSYFTVFEDAMDAFAPVVEALAGR